MTNTTLKFFYNGIKGSDGKLQKATFSGSELISYPKGTITIYARSGFSGDVAKAFAIENGTDIMTDYFERDRIRVTPSHPLYKRVKEALDKAEARKAAKYHRKNEEMLNNFNWVGSRHHY